MGRGGLKNLVGNLDREVSKALFMAGEVVEGEAARSITTGSAGGQKGGKHQHVRSRPGEAPNEEFGGLARNIETVQVEPFRVEVSSNAPYSVALEFGTSKMAARPFMSPAVQATRKKVQQIIADAVARSTRSAGA